jgi:hypothetical protein
MTDDIVHWSFGAGIVVARSDEKRIDEKQYHNNLVLLSVVVQLVVADNRLDLALAVGNTPGLVLVVGDNMPVLAADSTPDQILRGNRLDLALVVDDDRLDLVAARNIAVFVARNIGVEHPPEGECVARSSSLLCIWLFVVMCF